MPVPEWFAELLQHELQPWLALSQEQISQLYEHYRFLERWNEKISLTSLKPGPELVIRHYCESLYLAYNLRLTGGERIADLGSGAGFPGVPMAVACLNCQVTLIESVQRKAVFLREATRHLANIQVLAHRAEEVDDHFEWVVSRAVNSKDILKNIPRLAPKVGLLVGESGLRELQSASVIAWSEPVRLPWGDRRFVILGEYVPRGTVPRET